MAIWLDRTDNLSPHDYIVKKLLYTNGKIILDIF